MGKTIVLVKHHTHISRIFDDVNVLSTMVQWSRRWVVDPASRVQIPVTLHCCVMMAIQYYIVHTVICNTVSIYVIEVKSSC